MKLHLPKKLRIAIFSCLAVAGSIATTVGTGFVVGGSVAIAFVAAHAQAEINDLPANVTGDDAALDLTQPGSPGDETGNDVSGNSVTPDVIDSASTEFNDGSPLMLAGGVTLLQEAYSNPPLTIIKRQTGSCEYTDYESISFEDIDDGYADGGAIYGGSFSTITLSGNESVTFDGNTASSSDGDAYGGAIYGASYRTITLSDNGSVTFSGNTASSSSKSASGGAIYGSSGSTITLSGNGSVTFSGNTASSSYSSARGGAIYGDESSTITLSGNESVTFDGNTASSSASASSSYICAYGGAIYGDWYSTITLSDNGSVIFSGNTASSSDDSAYGGAIYGYRYSTITLSGNESVTFSGNTASSSDGSAYGGAISGGWDSITITLSDNGSVIFSGNTASSSSSYSFAYGGAIYGDESSTITLSGNESVTFDGNTATDGGAIYGDESSTITLSGNGSVTFDGNTATDGGAIYGYRDSTITLSGNESVTFSGNTASGSSYIYASGGAIYGAFYSTITLSDNGSVTFSGNTASSSDASGGAIYGASYSTITLSGNESVTFDGNTATDGGAIYGYTDSTITLSGNGSVTFSGNTASGSSSASGGAIDGSTITLRDNGSVTFSGNTASSSSSYSDAYGGAISGHTITLSDNGSVIFSGNTASGSSSASGGAIYGYRDSTITLSGNESVIFSGNTATDGGAIYGYTDSTITLSDNGSVTFSGNTASSSYSSARGGSIYTYGDLNIRNNDSVLFEKNAENADGSYRLRSIYAVGSGGIISFSAGEGKSIEFRDSIYIGSGSTVNFNEDYTDSEGIVHWQTGDIIFTGATTEADLLAVKGSAGTAVEIANSRTSIVNAVTNLYGGRLRVEEGAIYHGYGLIAMDGSESTVRVQNASLDHSGYELTFNAGTTLELVGENTIFGNVNMLNDSSLCLEINSDTRYNAIAGGIDFGDNVNIELSLGAGVDTTNQILLYVSDTVTGWDKANLSISGSSYNRSDLTWVDGHLLLNYEESTFNRYFNGVLVVTNQQVGSQFLHHYQQLIFENISTSTSGGAIYGVESSTITLSGNESVTFSGNTASSSASSSDYGDAEATSSASGGAIYGDASSTITLRGNGSVTFSGNTASSSAGASAGDYDYDYVSAYAYASAYGGAIYGSTINLNDNRSVIFRGNTTSSSATAYVGNPGVFEAAFFAEADANASGGAIGGSTITLSNNDSVIFSGNTASITTSTGAAIYDPVYDNAEACVDAGAYAYADALIGTQASAYAYAVANASGGAIDGSTITLSNNGIVTFSGNTTSSSIYADVEASIYSCPSGYAYASADAYADAEANASGGAIDGSTITLSNNSSVTFSGNTTSSSIYAEAEAYSYFPDTDWLYVSAFAYVDATSSASGGAIYGSAITLSDNGSVTFSGNTTSSSIYADASIVASAYAYGGAINGSTITLSDNGSVTFSGNTASSSDGAYGGAIYGGRDSTITLSGNESVTFDGNTASSSDAYGGAIYGSTITLSNNGSVIFSGNTASSSDGAYGGAIYASGNLNIRNNDSVLFEKNVEINNGSYCLRSIHAGGSGDIISFSAGEGKSIEFRDSIYIGSGSTVNFNEDYTDSEGIVHRQTGDIIFTGATTEADFLAVKGSAGTVAEIANSRTSKVNAVTNLYGGRLIVEDDAIYRGDGITAMDGSESMVRVQNASLVHSGYELIFHAGTTLELVGENTIWGNVNMLNDSSLRLVTSPSARCNDIVGSIDFGGNVNIELSLGAGIDSTNQIVLYVSDTVTGWETANLSISGSLYNRNDLTWIDGLLLLNYDESTFNRYFNGSAIVSSQQAGFQFLHHYQQLRFEKIHGGAIYGYSDSTITLSDNGSVTFDGNNTASSSGSSYGGAIYGGESSTITLSNNGSVTFSENTSSSYGGAIYGGESSTITLSNNGSVTFSENTSSSYGGAIYGRSDSTITLIDNGSVTFSGNTTFGYGGAIYGRSDSTITLSGNEIVTFDGNTAEEGGAIYGGRDSTITLIDNGSVTFSGNAASSRDSYADGGAIYGSSGSTITLSGNEIVSFDGNTGNGYYGAYGGAIYGDTDSTITLIDNGSVTFSGNTASGSSSATGGAIDGSTITQRDNGSVTFSGNTASSSSSYSDAYGGAIYGHTITLSDNGSVIFSGNTASGSSSAFGGAIYASGNLNIRNNDSVLFGKNAEITNGFYRLRSIHAGGSGDIISFSAGEGKSIEFRDSIYIGSGSTVNFNEDYTDSEGIVHWQTGDIIFTGATTEADLLAVKGSAGTVAEIANSRTSLVNAVTNLYGGRLRVEDGAIYEGQGINVIEGSGATVLLKDATLAHSGYELTFNSGTTLELIGDNTISGDIYLQSGSNVVFNLLENPGITTHDGSLSMADDVNVYIDLGNMPELDRGEEMTLKLLQNSTGNVDWSSVEYTVQNQPTGWLHKDLKWENGYLTLSIKAGIKGALWTNESGDSKWNCTSRNWQEGSWYFGFIQEADVTLGSIGAGTITLEGDIVTSNLTVTDGSRYVLEFADNATLSVNGNLKVDHGSSLTIESDLTAESVSLASGGTLTVDGTLTASEVQMNGAVNALQAGAFGAQSMNFVLDRATLEGLELNYRESSLLAQAEATPGSGFAVTLNGGTEAVQAAAYKYTISTRNGAVLLTADYAHAGMQTWYRGGWVGDSQWTDYYVAGYDAVDGVESVNLNGDTVEGANLYIAYEDVEGTSSIVTNGTLEFEYVDMGGGQFELGQDTTLITDELYGKGETLVLHEGATLETPKLTLGTLVMDGGEVTLKKATINTMSGTVGTLNIDQRGSVTVKSDVTLTGLNNEGTLNLGKNNLTVNALVDVGGNVTAGEVQVQCRGSRMAEFDALVADKVTVINNITTGRYTDDISVGDGSAIGELVAETLEVREGTVTLGRSSGSTDISLLNLDLQEDATLVLNQRTSLAVTEELTATEGATVKLNNGAGISYGDLSVSNRNSATATTVNAYELAEGEFSALSNAHVGVNSSEDTTISWKLTDSSLQNLGSGTLTVDNADNTLKDIYATGGDVVVLNVESLELQQLELAAGMSLSAYVENVQHPDYEARVSVSDKVMLGAGATLNVDLVIERGATLELGGTVSMGSDLHLYSNTTLSGSMLTTIQTAETGSRIELFTGIDSLYFNGVKQEQITLNDRLMAETYFANLSNELNRFYYLTYDNSVEGEGVLSIEIESMTIPEPTTATLSLLALAALAMRRRRK